MSSEASRPYHEIMRASATAVATAQALISRSASRGKAGAASLTLTGLRDSFFHYLNARQPHQARAIAQVLAEEVGPFLVAPREMEQLLALKSRSDAAYEFLGQLGPQHGEDALFHVVDLRQVVGRPNDHHLEVLAPHLWPVAMRLHPAHRLGRAMLKECLTNALQAAEEAGVGAGSVVQVAQDEDGAARSMRVSMLALMTRAQAEADRLLAFDGRTHFSLRHLLDAQAQTPRMLEGSVRDLRRAASDARSAAGAQRG